MESKKLVLFGAGKIGRSFIGRLFSQSGYEVVFIDIDEEIIHRLNKAGKYQVIVKGDEAGPPDWVEHVRGVLASETHKVIEEIVTSDIIATAVGQKALSTVAPMIAAGLNARFEKFPGSPIDIILAENLREAASVFKNELIKSLSDNINIDQYIGLVETSIGKMVPLMIKSETKKDPLLVYAEPFDTLILDKKAFKNPIPKVIGLAPKENMTAWVDRKLFIHNLGHAAAAYYGNKVYPELVYVHEIMAKPDAFETVRSTMMQAADILLKQYPGEFSKDELTEHINDLLHRFSNEALRDTVYRLGQDIYRKLGPEDRLVGALKAGLKVNMPIDKILFIITCTLDFYAVDDQGNRIESDLKFSREASLGISHILESACGLTEKEYPEIHEKAKRIIKNKRRFFRLWNSD